MTRDEFLDKYGDVVVMFSSYYKYTFTFRTELPDGSILSVDYGGNHDEIYRYGLKNNEQTTVRNLWPYQGSVYKDGSEVEGFYDY